MSLWLTVSHHQAGGLEDFESLLLLFRETGVDPVPSLSDMAVGMK